MISKEQFEAARTKATEMLKSAGIAFTQKEFENFEIADMGLNDLQQIGLELITYENNDRYCAKELILFPYQTCPEHRHPEINGKPGKRETFRVRKGVVYLYVSGPATANIKAKIPKGYEPYFTAFHEIVLNAGEQYTLEPNTLHWFQGGENGAIVSEFSSTSFDELDIFTDPNIKRAPEVDS